MNGREVRVMKYRFVTGLGAHYAELTLSDGQFWQTTRLADPAQIVATKRAFVNGTPINEAAAALLFGKTVR